MKFRNRAQLAEGWYDPITKSKADSAAALEADDGQQEGRRRGRGRGNDNDKRRESPQYIAGVQNPDESEDEDIHVGPSLPGQTESRRERALGPAVPNFQDLEMRKGESGAPIYNSTLLTWKHRDIP